MAISVSQIYLSVIVGVFLIVSFIINFTFLVTLLKLRRLNKSDKSNFFLTHLILADFICAILVLVPSGVGVYNGTFLDIRACHLQLYFFTFFFSLTFYGLLALSIERYIKYKRPLAHIEFFTKQSFDEEIESPSKHIFHKTLGIIVIIWLLNIFIGFIPLFNNYNDVQFFENQSQCGYIYEANGFIWWLWVYFFVSLTVPFIASLMFFILTFRLIFKNAEEINKVQNKMRGKKKQRSINLSAGSYFCNLLFPRLSRKKNAAEKFVSNKLKAESHQYKKKDTTQLPENIVYYQHLINVDHLEEENIYNNIHVRKQLLIQFKYDTERSKTTSFFIILVLTYLVVFPVFVIHFYRAYNYNGSAAYDSRETVEKTTYATFVWISYLAFILKSMVCLIHNKFYRYSLYQSANFRGFHGDFDYEVKKFVKEIKLFENRLIGTEQKTHKKSRGHSQNKLIDSTEA